MFATLPVPMSLPTGSCGRSSMLPPWPALATGGEFLRAVRSKSTPAIFTQSPLLRSVRVHAAITARLGFNPALGVERFASTRSCGLSAPSWATPLVVKVTFLIKPSASKLNSSMARLRRNAVESPPVGDDAIMTNVIPAAF